MKLVFYIEVMVVFSIKWIWSVCLIIRLNINVDIVIVCYLIICVLEGERNDD